MPVTAAQQEQLIALTTLMFDAPPGATYLAELEGYLEQGMSLADIAVGLSQTPLFNSQFSGMTSDKAKIDLVLSAVGIDEQSDAYEEAFNHFQVSLDNGVPPGLALQQASSFLSSTTDETFTSAAAVFKNKVATGVTHSVELGLSSEKLADLKEAIKNVTDDPQSVAEAARALNQQKQEQEDGTEEEEEESSGGGTTVPTLTVNDATKATGSYHLEDTATHLATANATVLNGATDITVTDSADATQAGTVIAATNGGTTTFDMNIEDGASALDGFDPTGSTVTGDIIAQPGKESTPTLLTAHQCRLI